MSQQQTLGTFAAAQGRRVDEVLAAARRANVVAWSEHTPLDDREVDAITAALTSAPASLPPPPSLAAPSPPGAAPARRSAGPLAGAVAVSMLLLAIGVVLLSGGDDGDPVEPSSPDDVADRDESDDEPSCVDLLVEVVNGLDLGGVDSSDGLDDEERADLDRQLTAAEEENRDLAADGECVDALDDADAAEEFATRVSPEARDALAAMAATRFQEVGDAIGGGSGDATGSTDLAVDRDACIALLAAQINAVDLGNVDATDGFSEAELDDITDQRFEFARLHPELRPEGVCAPVASGLTNDELGRLTALVLPDRRDLLGGT